MLSAARHWKFFSLVGIRRRCTLTTKLNYPFVAACDIRWQREPFNEPHQSKLDPVTVTKDTKGERAYYISI